MSRVQSVYSLGARNEAEGQAEEEPRKTQSVISESFILYSVSDSVLLLGLDVQDWATSTALGEAAAPATDLLLHPNAQKSRKTSGRT